MNYFLCALAVGVLTMTPLTAMAQDDSGTTSSSHSIEVMSFDDQDGFGGPMIIATETDGGNGVMSSMRVMSSDGTGMMFSEDPGFFMGGDDDFSMLQNPGVQKDLEMMDDQVGQILKWQQTHASQLQEAIGDISNGMTPEGIERLKETLTGLKTKQKTELDSLLLPHQKERLKQVALQMRMQQMGTASALAGERIAEELGISDEQKERLQNRAAELSSELQEKIAELRESMKEELLNELTPDQQEKLKALTGSEFKQEANDWTERFERSGPAPRRPRGGSGIGGENAADGD